MKIKKTIIANNSVSIFSLLLTTAFLYWPAHRQNLNKYGLTNYLVNPLLGIIAFISITANSYAVNTDCGIGYNAHRNYYGGNHSFQPNESAFAALKADGSITVWGDEESGGSGAPSDSGYIRIIPAKTSFAALKANGSITAWGTDDGYEVFGAPNDSGYISIASTEHGYAALKADGSITAWGDWRTFAPTDSGYISISSTQKGYAALKTDSSITSWGGSVFDQPTDSGYINIVSNELAFSAMKADGSIVSWGPSIFGQPTDSGYINVVSSGLAFAAMKDDGRLNVWGDSDLGGSGAPTDQGYVSIAATFFAFAAIKADGSINAWGDSDRGGSGAPTDAGYVSIVSNDYAFAALKDDGSITAWGDEFRGGNGEPSDSGFISITASESGFAALKSDGRIKAWGEMATFASLGLTDLAAPTDSGYVIIVSNRKAFAAMKADGSITAWGSDGWGGTGEPTDSGYISINGVGPTTPKDCAFTRDPLDSGTDILPPNSDEPFLSFPLDCGDKNCNFKYTQGAYTPNSITSVLDHQMDSIYLNQDGVVTAFTGETGKGEAKAPWCYPKEDGGAFSVIDLYRGTEDDNCTPELGLNYDNHPAYDYRAQYETPVKAAAAGKVVNILNTETSTFGSCVPRGIESGGCDAWGYVGIDHGNGYVTQYGHLSRIDVKAGESVAEGQQVGLSGDKGVPGFPHLHFEVLKEHAEKPYGYAFVDPYGWEGEPEIDYLAQINNNQNVRLWKYDPRDCLLNWAEQDYQNLFSPSSPINSIHHPYLYRYYEDTDAYVGFSSMDNHVYYLGPDRNLQDVGELSDWLLTADCQPPVIPITGQPEPTVEPEPGEDPVFFF